MGLPKIIAEGWMNEHYAQSTNAQHPDINHRVPGAPYFVDVATALPGQWVRLNFHLANAASPDTGNFWCVGILAEVVDPVTVRVEDIGVEGGEAPASMHAGRWTAVLEHKKAGEGAEWVVTTLQPDGSALLKQLLAAGSSTDVKKAVAAYEKAGVDLPLEGDPVLADFLRPASAVEICSALLQHPDEEVVRTALERLGTLCAAERPARAELLTTRLRSLENRAEEKATLAAVAKVRALLGRR